LRNTLPWLNNLVSDDKDWSLLFYPPGASMQMPHCDAFFRKAYSVLVSLNKSRVPITKVLNVECLSEGKLTNEEWCTLLQNYYLDKDSSESTAEKLLSVFNYDHNFWWTHPLSTILPQKTCSFADVLIFNSNLPHYGQGDNNTWRVMGFLSFMDENCHALKLANKEKYQQVYLWSILSNLIEDTKDNTNIKTERNKRLTDHWTVISGVKVNALLITDT